MSTTLSKLYLETERLVIRPLEKADLAFVYVVHEDDEVNRYLPYETWLSWDDALNWYRLVQERHTNNHAEHFNVQYLRLNNEKPNLS